MTRYHLACMYGDLTYGSTPQLDSSCWSSASTTFFGTVQQAMLKGAWRVVTFGAVCEAPRSGQPPGVRPVTSSAVVTFGHSAQLTGFGV